MIMTICTWRIEADRAFYLCVGLGLKLVFDFSAHFWDEEGSEGL